MAIDKTTNMHRIPAYQIALALSCALLGKASQASDLAQWPAAAGGNDHWYQVMVSDGSNWDGARDAAVAAGGYLATITSAGENAFVFQHANRPQYWEISGGRSTGPRLGGFQPDPDVPAALGWEWVTGEAFSYTAWDGGEPNDFGQSEDALGYANNTTTPTSEWNDSPRTIGTDRSYVIEYDSLPDIDSDGIDETTDNCQFVANPDQIDGDGDGIGNLCDADLNNDCIVNTLDLGLFRDVFFSTDAAADFNGDGIVNAQDLGILRTLFFAPPGPSTQANDCG